MTTKLWAAVTRRRLLWIAAACDLLLVTASGVTAGAATPAPTPSPTPPPSAVGNEAVIWLAVSPAYLHTGTVIAASASLSGCPSNTNCSHIWVTRDGGYSWKRATGQGWAGIHPVVAVDGHGREILYGAANNGILRSDDYGNTWQAVGPNGGTPTPAPSFANDAAIAVAGASDYVLRGTQAQKVTGSGGAMGDSFFAYSPSYPQGGANPPALLGGSDPKSGLPAVQACNQSLSCSGTAVLNGAGPMAGPPQLYLSHDFEHDGAVFAQTAAGIFKSTTGGKVFTPLAIGASGAAETATSMLALAPHYSESGDRTAYAAIMQVFGSGKDMKRSGGVYRTADGGTTWKAVGSLSPLDDGSTAVAVAPDGRVFAAYLTNKVQGGLLCSTDGKSWRAFCPAVVSNTGHGQASGGTVGGASPCSACGATASGQPSAGDATSGGNRGHGGDAGAASVPGGLTGLHQATPSRPWPILLILAIGVLLMVGAAGVVRRRKAPNRT